jgi:hypothetical protein
MTGFTADFIQFGRETGDDENNYSLYLQYYKNIVLKYTTKLIIF